MYPVIQTCILKVQNGKIWKSSLHDLFHKNSLERTYTFQLNHCKELIPYKGIKKLQDSKMRSLSKIHHMQTSNGVLIHQLFMKSLMPMCVIMHKQ